MKKGAVAKQPVRPQAPKGTRGLFLGEGRAPEGGYVVDKGAHYLLRSGFEPSVTPIGATAVQDTEGGCPFLARSLSLSLSLWLLLFRSFSHIPLSVRPSLKSMHPMLFIEGRYNL